MWIWSIVGACLPLIAFPRPAAPIDIGEAFPSGELRVGIDAGHAPFAIYNGDRLAGIDVDLANAIGEYLGIPIRLVPLGFDGLYDALYADQVDVLIAGLSPDPARQNRVLYTPQYFESGIVLVVPRSSPIQRMTDLGGRRVAYEFGSNAHSEVDIWARRILPFMRMPYQFADHALDAVRIGDADAAVVDAVTAHLYLRDHPEWQAHMPQVILSIPYVMVLREDRASQAVVITAALEAIEESGELAAIIAKWL